VLSESAPHDRRERTVVGLGERTQPDDIAAIKHDRGANNVPGRDIDGHMAAS
jgi:hypothetical protein